MRSGLFLTAMAVLGVSCTVESHICGRMETLCGTSRDDCKALVQSAKESFGDQGVQDVKACFVDAQSCSEASGCVAGKGLQNVGAAAGAFLKGVMKGLQPDEKK